LATTPQAGEEARGILEMAQAAEVVPRAVKKDLIGKDGVNIRDLERRSQVIKICSLEHLRMIRERESERRGDGRREEEDDDWTAGGDSLMQQPSDESLCKLIIIGPKEYVPFAKMLIQTQVQHLAQQRDFLDRQRTAEREIASGQGRGGQGRGGAAYDEAYEQGYDQRRGQGRGYYQQGQGQAQGQSRRRQQRYAQQQQQQYQQQDENGNGYEETEQSSRTLSDFDYNNNNNNNGGRRQRRGQGNRRNMQNFPPIGGQREVEDENGEQATKQTWNDLDELGDDGTEEQQQQEQEQGQRSGRRGLRSGRRNRKAKQEIGREDSPQMDAEQQQQQQPAGGKSVWKAKQPNSENV